MVRQISEVTMLLSSSLTASSAISPAPGEKDGGEGGLGIFRLDLIFASLRRNSASGGNRDPATAIELTTKRR
jgi:hypothetical protein